jgi:ribulose kinase
MSRSVVVSVDIGSSSVRCSGYELQSENNRNSLSDPIASCSFSFCSVHPLSGKILIHGDMGNQNLFDIIDNSIDDVIKKISSFYGSTNTRYQIKTFGFSTFAMNLVAVDANGSPIGSDYTLSYACNSASVVAEAKTIKK